MCFCSVCKEPSRYNLAMLISNKENFRCKPTNTDITRCLDYYDTTLYTSKHYYINMFQKGYDIHHYKNLYTFWGYLWLAAPLHQISTYPPRYQTLHLDINVSLNMANHHMVKVSALDFHVWQHLKDNSNETHLQHLTTILLILINEIYQYSINGTQHIMPFNTTDESTEDTDLIWTLFCIHEYMLQL